MSPRKTSVLPRRLPASELLLANVNLAPVRALYNPDGSLAGFATNEASLYFLAPSTWAPLARGRTPPVQLTLAGASPTGQALHDLRLVLSPDYARAAPTVAALRGQDPRALFFPLPMNVEHVRLFLPQDLGDVQAELAPDEQGMSTPVAVYYRLRFNSEQLEVLRELARGNLTLSGAIEYSYPAVGGDLGETVAPITILLAASDLVPSTAPPPDPTAWLVELLPTTRLRVPGALDGRYPLGGGLSVLLTNSRIEGHLSVQACALQIGDANVIHLQPTQPENLAGTVDLEMPQLGATLHADYWAAFSASLDLSSMFLTVTQFDVRRLAVNGSPSPFYAAWLGRLMKDPDVRARLSRTLSDELQRSILDEALSSLGGGLP